MRDLEITGAGLEAAFLQLTGDDHGTSPAQPPTEVPAMITMYTRSEMLRLLRNKRSFIFSLIFPLALFLVIAGSQKDTTAGVGRR